MDSCLTVANKTVLGSGEFGIVHPGIYKLEPVAIKLFKRSAEIDEFKSVLAELKIMAYLGSHDHIIKFVGADVSEIAQRNSLFNTTSFSEKELPQNSFVQEKLRW